MKKLFYLFLLLPVLAGCDRTDAPDTDIIDTNVTNIGFTDTGCNKGQTKSETDPSLLILKFEGGNLRVTRTNALMNCSINGGGIVCEVSSEGTTINYNVYEKDGPTVNCCCMVNEMTSLVEGLTPGVKYTMKYCYYEPFTFLFERGLHIIIDVDSIRGSF